MHDHLKTCQVKREMEATEFPSAKKATGEKGKVVVETHFDPDVMRSKMARAIVMHEYTLSIVEHQGLQDVMSSLNQLGKLVSQNIIKKEILDIYKFWTDISVKWPNISVYWSKRKLFGGVWFSHRPSSL